MVDYHDFCIQEALFYMNKAKHILEVDIKDPEKYYKESLHNSKVMYNSLPFIILTEQFLSHKASQDTEESLQDTPS